MNGEGGYQYLAKTNGISDSKCLREWVNNYNAFGDEGLMRSRKQEMCIRDRRSHPHPGIQDGGCGYHHCPAVQSEAASTYRAHLPL